MNIDELLKRIHYELVLAGKLELQAQRILHDCCPNCGIKLPENYPSYHCEPDCASHLADGYKENEQ